MNRWIWVFVWTSLAIQTGMLHAAGVDNLITNSIFAGDQMPPASWQLTGTSAEPLSVMQEGDQRFLRLRFDQPGTGGLTQTLALKPDAKAISVTAWLRGSNIRNGGQDFQRGCFEFQFLDSKDQRLGGFPKFMVPNKSDWEHYTQIREVPQGTVALRVNCVNYGGQGTFDFAHLSIVPLAANQLQLTSSSNAISFQAHWLSRDRSAIFLPGETISLQLDITGRRAPGEEILWQLVDDRQALLEQGQIPVTAGDGAFKATLTLHPQKTGYFVLHARLRQAGIGLPKRGTAPAGCVTFGILPDITALPLKHMDDSRFGVQGTTFIDSGKFMQGDPYNDYYKAMGVRWIHRNRRPQELEAKPGSFQPRLTEESLANNWPYDWDNRLAPLIDAHGVPQWLIDGPDALRQKKNYSNTFDGQKYLPRDMRAYGDILEKIAREAVNLHQHRFTYMRHNYYQIQWEPDWYWLGSDEQFVDLYRTAHQRIHAVDPEAKLLGCNFGVLQTGNDWLERFFQIGLGQYMDGIVTHAYYTYKAQPEVGIRPQFQRLVRMTRKYMGPDVPIYHSEWGDHYDGDFIVQSVTPGMLHDEMSLILRGHLILLGEGADATWFFYASDPGSRGGGMAFNMDTVPRYGPTRISPKPLTMGVATMTRLLEGTKNLGTVDYLGDDVLGYAFDRDGKVLMALWSTDGKTREVMLGTTQAVDVYDCFGNMHKALPDGGMVKVSVSDLPVYVLGLPTQMLPGKTLHAYPAEGLSSPPTVEAGTCLTLTQGQRTDCLPDDCVPATLSTGTWLLVRRDMQNGRLLEIDRLCVDSPWQLTLLPYHQQDAWGYQLQIQNVSNLTHTLHFADQTITLDAGQTSQVFLAVQQLHLEAGRYQLALTDEAGRRLQVSVPAKESLNTFAFTPHIDGDWRDWQQEMFQRVSGEEALAYRKAPLAGPADMSLDYALANDDQALYGVIKVYDQKHLPPTDPQQTWRGDSIQIAIGSNLRPDGNWGSLHRISFTRQADDRNVSVRQVIGPPPLPPVIGQSLDGQVTCAIHRDETAGLTVYEFAIPWHQLELAAKPQQTSYVGFGALINDADTLEQIHDDARKTMTVGGGAGLFTRHPVLGLFPLRHP